MRVAGKATWFCMLLGIRLWIPVAGFGDFAGSIMVFAWDSGSGTTPPPATTAYLNNTESQSYGTNDLVVFSGYFEAGMHAVEVSTEAGGYLLRQSPTEPDAIHNPYSSYGNPRYVAISENTNAVPVSFQFDPVVTATAVVRDAWTMERLGGVAIEFTGRTGPNANVVYSDYPWGASYASNWTSDAEGRFPTNTILYLDDYDLTVTKTGYLPFSETRVITNALPGDAFDLGTIFLQPVDVNSNLLADAWETAFFGSGSNVTAGADADGDGISNEDEYLAGTDPTNRLSCLRVECSLSTNGFTLAWPVEPCRTYRVCGTTNLCADTWVQVGGPWEATNGQPDRAWVETNMDLSWNSHYRIEVVPSWWKGTNQVLINTNMPHSSGGGTNTWTGGPPPIPGGG